MSKEYKSRYCYVCKKEVDHSKGDNGYNILFKTEGAYIKDMKIVCINSPAEGGCDSRDKAFDSYRRYTPEVLASLYEDYFIPDELANQFLFYKNKVDKKLAEVIALTKLNLIQLNKFWKHDKLNNILYYLNKSIWKQYHIILNDNDSADYWLEKFCNKEIDNEGLLALADAFSKIGKRINISKFEESLLNRKDK